MHYYTCVITELTISFKEPASEAMKPLCCFCCPMNKPSFIGCSVICVSKQFVCAAFKDPKSEPVSESQSRFHSKAFGFEWTSLCGMLVDSAAFDHWSRRLLISKWGEYPGFRERDDVCGWPFRSKRLLGEAIRELCCEVKLGKALSLLIWSCCSGGTGNPWSMYPPPSLWLRGSDDETFGNIPAREFRRPRVMLEG